RLVAQEQARPALFTGRARTARTIHGGGGRRRTGAVIVSAERRYWIAVASADHARRGRELGIMQVGHGKGAPLRRIRAGDGVVYYSPTGSLGGKDRLQAFTSIGIAKDDRIYQVEMGAGFRPFRRDVS